MSTINITFRHEIPPQHTIERLAGTRVPTKSEKEEIKKYVEIKKGPYDCKEDARIVHNWRKFCKVCYNYILSFPWWNYIIISMKIIFE